MNRDYILEGLQDRINALAERIRLKKEQAVTDAKKRLSKKIYD